MQIHRLSLADVYAALHTSPHGLSEEEVERRLKAFGPNEISQPHQVSRPRMLFRQFTHFLALLLGVAAGLAYLAGSLQPGEGMELLAHAIVAVIIINAIFSFFQEYKAERASAALRQLLPDRVRVLRGGKATEAHAREIVPGDLLLLEEGDRVPADARLIEAVFMKVNNAPLTGESEPQSREPDPVGGGSLFEASNIVFAGTTLFSGSGRALVFATGDATEFGQVARLTQKVPQQAGPLQLEIRRVTRVVTVLSLSMGISFFVLGSLIGRTFWQNFIFAIGILVANVPEGLLPTVTLALSMASQRMARRKALVKDLPAVEALGSTTVICADKTGTLTQNRMDVRAIVSRGAVFRLPEHPRLGENPFLYQALRLCNNAALEGERVRGDPLEVALLQATECLVGNDLPDHPRLYEVPFDPDRKRMTTVHGCSAATPRQKLRIVTVLKERGEVVAVTGDGVNDGPALKHADIGVAMGVTGTDVAREAAQMVLLDDNFATIVAAVEEGRAVFENIRKFITYIFTSNIPEIVPYLAYVLLGIPLPLTILQILAIDLGTDMLPALALGGERPSGDLMRAPPRPRRERLLTTALLRRAYLFLGPIEAAAAMTGYFFILWQGDWSWGQTPSPLLYRQATTACLTAVIVAQIANGFVCRSPRTSVFTLGLLTNRLLLLHVLPKAVEEVFAEASAWEEIPAYDDEGMTRSDHPHDKDPIIIDLVDRAQATSERPVKEFSLRIAETEHEFYPGGAKIQAWAFNGRIPGPTLWSVSVDPLISTTNPARLPYAHPSLSPFNRGMAPPRKPTLSRPIRSLCVGTVFSGCF